MLNRILNSDDILGSYIEHLAKNPSDFLALVKAKPKLASTYAEKFSPGHVLSLLGTAQDQKLNLMTEIISITPDINDKITPYKTQTFPLIKSNDEIIEMYKAMGSELIIYADDCNKNHIYRYKDEYAIFKKNDPNRFHRDLPSNFSSRMSFSYSSVENGNLVITMKLERNSMHWHFYAPHTAVHDAFRNSEERIKWNQKEQERIRTELSLAKETVDGIVLKLLSKLDHTVCIMDPITHRRRAVMDLELDVMPVQSLRSFFWKKPSSPVYPPNIIDILLKRGKIDLIGKIIAFLSPNHFARELEKNYTQTKQVFALLIEKTSENSKVIETIIMRMQEMPADLFVTMMKGFHFDVLKAVKIKDKNAAGALYNISPAFMQKQYPESAAEYAQQHFEDPDKTYRRGQIYEL